MPKCRADCHTPERQKASHGLLSMGRTKISRNLAANLRFGTLLAVFLLDDCLVDSALTTRPSPGILLLDMAIYRCANPLTDPDRHAVGRRKERTMYQGKSALRILVLLGTALLSTLAVWTPHCSAQSPTVGGLLLQPDGIKVHLEGVCVDKIRARQSPPYFVVRDGRQPDSRVVVLCRPPVELANGVAIGVDGVLGTLPNGERCITTATVYAYFDGNGRIATWMPLPFTAFSPWLIKRSLAIPSSPIPPSDPSLPADGSGVPGVVTADSADGVSRFATVASLLATSPTILSPVELDCKPIVHVGDGFITVGDDTTDAVVKVYTSTSVRPTDRIVRLTGTAHSENGRLVIYADSGPHPYFDRQGFVGGVRVAGVGTSGYTATLSDATGASAPGGMNTMSIMSMVDPATSDGNWVYLTGQVVTYAGQYYSYDISPNQWVYVYDIQGLDRTPGIRVLSATGNPGTGAVVDVMAKLDTKDGQRLLGIWSGNPWDSVDLSSTTHSLEPKTLASSGPNLNPVGIINRDLGGATIGNNPGITGGHGLYNIGSLVRIWGKVLETGTYQFDGYGWDTTPYLRIDDGSNVPSGGTGGSSGVIVFGANQYDDWSDASIGDYVSVTGVTSVWKPNGSTDTYRSIWIPFHGGLRDMSLQWGRTPTEFGSITGTVKLYDMPAETATVRLYSTCGRTETLTVTRGTDGSGTASFTWNNIAKTVLVNDPYWGQSYDYPQYIISAQCDGFKTRTYNGITPDTPATARDLYLVPLRKIYVTTDNTYLDSCPGGTTSTLITATVRDAGHNLVTTPLTIRFRTNKGSFASGTIQHETSVVTTTGIATATLYAGPSEYGTAIVEATDDSEIGRAHV